MPRPTHQFPAAPHAGPIDLHSHLLPGIDDGCEHFEQTLETITKLQRAGFVGSVCTSHVFPEVYPVNTPLFLQEQTAELQRQLQKYNVNYAVWPGGELRLFDGVIAYLKEHGVPTLGESNCVLTEFWPDEDPDEWPEWIDDTFQWLILNNYQPILAHPERITNSEELPHRLQRLRHRGVWLQGNARCMTGEDGYHADMWVRRFLQDDIYDIIALDTHNPDTLESRLDGLVMIAHEFSVDTLHRLTIDAPRRALANRSQPHTASNDITRAG